MKYKIISGYYQRKKFNNNNNKTEKQIYCKLHKSRTCVCVRYSKKENVTNYNHVNCNNHRVNCNRRYPFCNCQEKEYNDNILWEQHNNIVNTTSCNFLPIEEMKITISCTGKYFIVFSSYCQITIPEGIGTYAVFVNNKLIEESVRLIGGTNFIQDNYHTMCTTICKKLEKNDIVEVKFKYNAANENTLLDKGSFEIHNKNMSVLKI